MEINFVLPVLNEELRFEAGIKKLLSYLDKNVDIPFIITIVDNGSTDKTGEIAKEYSKRYPEIFYKRIEIKGVGVAFREAVTHNNCDIIGYMDIDMSTDMSAISKMIQIFKEDRADIVNASRYNRKSELIGRSWGRNFIGYILVLLLKCIFDMKATDAICGFKFFKQDVAESLLKESSDETGWFLIIEMLLRAERRKTRIIELPVTWIYEEHTKVDVKAVTVNYLKQIYILKMKMIKESSGGDE